MNKTTSAVKPVSPKPVNPAPPAPKTWTVKSIDGKPRSVTAERMHVYPGGETLVFMNGNDIILAIALGAWREVSLDGEAKAE